MVIFKGYTDLELLANEPCIIDANCTIYPILVKHYNKFIMYSGYLTISKKKLNIESDLLSSIIMLFIQAKNEQNMDTSTNMKCVLGDFEMLFSIITHKDIKGEIRNGKFRFIGDGVIIDDNNYETVREVIMKMSLISEPKVFEDKLYEEMYYKSMKANRKESASLGDIILTVVQDLKYTFDCVFNLNIVQLYGLYSRIVHVKNSDAITIYRTCSDKLPKVDYTDGVIDNLFKEKDDSDLFADLGDLSNKLN